MQGLSEASHGARIPNEGHPLEVVPSRTASLVSSPPDGGFGAWMSGRLPQKPLQDSLTSQTPLTHPNNPVLSGFFVIMNTW